LESLDRRAPPGPPPLRRPVIVGGELLELPFSRPDRVARGGRRPAQLRKIGRGAEPQNPPGQRGGGGLGEFPVGQGQSELNADLRLRRSAQGLLQSSPLLGGALIDLFRG